MTGYIVAIVLLFIAILYTANRAFKYYILADIRLERIKRYQLRVDTILTTGKDPWEYKSGDPWKNEEKER